MACLDLVGRIGFPDRAPRDEVSGFRLVIGALLSVVIAGSVLVAGAVALERGSDQGGGASPQERQCAERGWRSAVVDVSGKPRDVQWKGPVRSWPKGAIIVMHGGGGEHVQWCGSNFGSAAAQVRFSELAVEDGLAVFLLNSSSEVSDNQGRICGKIWDDEVRDRPNLDLPFIEQIVQQMIPSLRPADSEDAIFLTGLSSGGYMAVRAATHFNTLVTAFAPVSSGDPYGWHRSCEAGLTARIKVEGAGYDNETGKQIIERNSCLSQSYPNEPSGTTGRHQPSRPSGFSITRWTGSTMYRAPTRSPASYARTAIRANRPELHDRVRPTRTAGPPAHQDHAPDRGQGLRLPPRLHRTRKRQIIGYLPRHGTPTRSPPAIGSLSKPWPCTPIRRFAVRWERPPTSIKGSSTSLPP